MGSQCTKCGGWIAVDPEMLHSGTITWCKCPENEVVLSRVNLHTDADCIARAKELMRCETCENCTMEKCAIYKWSYGEFDCSFEDDDGPIGCIRWEPKEVGNE